MKYFAIVLAALLYSQVGAFTPKKTALEIAEPAYSVRNLPGIVAPTGLFDPLKLGCRADVNTLKRYREAEIVHSRVAMLAVVGFLVGEAVEGSSFLFDASIQGPAITHLTQVPTTFWIMLALFIAKIEVRRAQYGWVSPEDLPIGQAGLLRADYIPGDLEFDPLKLKPKKPDEFDEMQTKELQNGRLAMIAAAGFLAQEMVDGKGIVEHFQS